MWSRSSVTSIVAMLGLVAMAHGEAVTFESLVRQMTDLGELAEFPDPAFTCRQFSSYDRKSTDPAVLTDENWFANGDAGKHLRAEKRGGESEWVMMDAEGPGAIVRIWSANPNNAGIFRVYLDGATEPVIEMPATEMLGGDGPMPFIKPISGTRSRGWNCYLPIPYAKHCKVTASEPGFYYQVNYRTYTDRFARVESYTPELAEEHASLIRSAASRLAQPSMPSLPGLSQRHVVDMDLGPEGVQEISMKSEDGGAVYRLALKVDADDIVAALRGCVLEIEFDDEGLCVQTPLGDFFGAAPGLNPYESLPSGVHGSGTMYSHWVMPYEAQAVVRVRNCTPDPVAVRGMVVTASRRWSRRSLYFHATWRAEEPISTRPRQDWTYLEASGKGRFVGDMLHVTNPVKHWWGEGDEKIYVDGETFPSHFGTGTEDYYGYAWCCNEPFIHAYHNQPRCDGPGNYGQTCVNRFHVIDTIPFKESFKFDMEVWHWFECEIAMATTSYWYARPGAKSTATAIDPESLEVVVPPPLPEPKRVEGALEGETMKVVSVQGGNAQVQESFAWEWSGAKQLWWIDAKPGQTLTLSFPVEQAGAYEILAVFTKAADYGIVEISVNDRVVGEPIDLYNNGVVPTPEISLGVFDLEKGGNLFKVKIAGANDKAIARHMFGLDYLMLKPAAAP